MYYRRILLVAVFLILPLVTKAEVVVVVAKKTPVSHLSKEQVAKIFLGKTNTFPDGSKVIPIDQPDGSEVRDEFYSKVANKNHSQLTAFWSKMIFTGDGSPPIVLDDNVAVRKSVAMNPGEIGYINKNQVDQTVKIILEP
jgi:ABC-type phosphate transport system substrate-binding protein